jgi:hypothetical protein
VSETLEDYLASEYHVDMGDIHDLELALKQAANVFIYTCNEGRWPYEFSNKLAGAKDSTTQISHGTQAMIAAALGKITGLSTLASGRQARLKLERKCKEDLEASRKQGIDCLVKDIEGAVISSTFGVNDPVTLSHLADLHRGMKEQNSVDAARLKLAVAPAISEAREFSVLDPDNRDLLRKLPSLHAEQATDPRAPSKTASSSAGRKPNYLKNAFVPLRIVRVVRDLGNEAVFPDLETDLAEKETFYTTYRRFFEATLHDHLSFSAIPDSRFDPAELIFCLEGLLLCAQHAVDEKLFERILEVLKDKQEASAHWRPAKPIYATPQGMTMLPVSVEGAVSLLRSISIMEGQSNLQRFSTSAVPMARRFWQWLRARMVRFEAPDPSEPTQKGASSTSGKPQASLDKGRYKHLTGWHSEHVNDPGLIHLWDTSQVIEFMLAYRELLERSIAGRSLLLSRLNINVPLRRLPPDWKNRWAQITQEFEPRLGCNAGDQIYVQLEKDFIQPWANREPVNYSMLLYGPPGTGKSSLAENIANALGLRMITVTVSDFLGSGGANVEARAKAIFQTLEAQSDTVILFDEIDSFLLDRDSELYRKQDTLFQFLTPGMLTKINDLGKKNRSMFVIATNYENRIDPAIKRKGRIDKRYLLELPNKARRIEIIVRLGKIKISPAEHRDSIEKDSLFFGFSDLKSAVEEASIPSLSAQSIADCLAQRDPSTSLESYIRRFGEEIFPFDELIGLINLAREVQEPYDLRGSCAKFSSAVGFSEFLVRLNREVPEKIHV